MKREPIFGFGRQLALLVCGTAILVAGENADAVKPQDPLLIPLKASPDDDAVLKLKKERYNVVVTEVKLIDAAIEDGSGSVDQRFEVFDRLIEAGLEVPQSTEQTITLLKRRISMMKAHEERLEFLKASGAFGEDDPGGLKLASRLYQTRYKRIGAEIDLLQTTQP